MFMKKVLSAVFALGLAFTVYAEWSPEKTAAFVKEVERVRDPEGKKKDVKTFSVVMSTKILKQNMTVQQTVVYKSEKKWKLSQKNGIVEATYYFSNGKCVCVNNLSGVSPVEGAQLEELKMYVRDIRGLFLGEFALYEKVSIADELEEYNGKKYVAVTCSYPPAKKRPPLKCLYDPKTKLPAFVFMKDPSNNQEVKIIFQDYKKIHGILFSTKQINITNQIEVKYEKITVNENYPDSMFEYKDN